MSLKGWDLIQDLSSIAAALHRTRALPASPTTADIVRDLADLCGDLQDAFHGGDDAAANEKLAPMKVALSVLRDDLGQHVRATAPDPIDPGWHQRIEHVLAATAISDVALSGMDDPDSRASVVGRLRSVTRQLREVADRLGASSSAGA